MPRLSLIAAAAIMAALVPAVHTAPSFNAGGLTFAPWTARSGIVTHEDEPLGPWATSHQPSIPGNDYANAAVTAFPRHNTVVSVSFFRNTSAADVTVTTRVRAIDADTGARRWPSDVVLTGPSGVAFVQPMPLSFGTAMGDTAVAVAVDGRLSLLDQRSGRILSEAALPLPPQTMARYLDGGAPQPSPLAPFQAHLAPTTPGAATFAPMAVVISWDLTAAMVLTAAADGTGLRLAGIVRCDIQGDGATTSIIQAALYRGDGRVVVQCQRRVVEYHVLTNTTRTVPSNVGAITTIEHSATAAAGAPTLPLTGAGSLQDVYFAAYSTLENAVVVGTLDFATGNSVQCTAVHSLFRVVRSIRVLADNTLASSTPTPRGIIVQTTNGLVALAPPPVGACPWVVLWAATNQEIASTGAALQHRMPGPPIFDLGVVTVIPTRSATALLAAVRLGPNFFIVDVAAQAVVWSETATGVSCYEGGYPLPVNPLFVAVGPALDRVLLGCPKLYVVARLPNMATYSGAAIRPVSPGEVPPFSTQAGHRVNVNDALVAAPMIFRGTIVKALPNSLSAANADGASFRVATTYAKAELNGVVFAMNSGPSSSSALVSAVGAAGQEIWNRTLPKPGTTTAAALQPFGQYLLAAPQSWTLYILNASSGAVVDAKTFPFECTAGEGSKFYPLRFEHFVAMDPNFAAAQRSGLPHDASRATAVTFSFGTCEYILGLDLTLRQLSNGGTSRPFLARAQLNDTVVASVTALGVLRAYDLSNAVESSLMWEVQPPVFIGAFANDVTPTLRMSGGVIAVSTSFGVSALTADIGTTLWVDVHKNKSLAAFFDPESLAVYGDVVVIASANGVAGYHVQPQPVNAALPHGATVGDISYGTAPQQVRWREGQAQSLGVVGTGRLSQYGRYITTTGAWAAALTPATGAVVWESSLPPPSTGLPAATKGYNNMIVAENIVSIATRGRHTALFQLNEATGGVIQLTSAFFVHLRTFAGDRVSFLPKSVEGSAGEGEPPLAVITWPTFRDGNRVLPLAPELPPLPPAPYVAVAPGYERPTYAPAPRPPLPPFPVAVNTTVAPSVEWSLPWDDNARTGVSFAHRTAIRYSNSDGYLRAYSLDDPKTKMVWYAGIQCHMSSRGVFVSDDTGVAVVTCHDFMAAFNISNGAALWSETLNAAPFNSRIISASSALFGPGGSPNREPVLIAVSQGQDAASSVIRGYSTTKATLWTTPVDCALEAGAGASGITASTNPAAQGEGSNLLPANVMQCENGTSLIVNPATGAVTLLDVIVAGSTRHRTMAAINPTGSTARFVDAGTGATTASGALQPPIGYTVGDSVPNGLGLVAVGAGGADVLVEVTQSQTTIVAYTFNARTSVFGRVWSKPISDIMAAAGFGPSATLRLMGLSQPAVEESRHAVLGLLSPSGVATTTAATDVLFRLSLADGSVVASNVSDPNGATFNSNTFVVYTPSAVDARSTGHYLVSSNAYTALVSIDTLQPSYVNSLYTYSNGPGVLVPTEPLSFVSAATHAAAPQLSIVGKWGLEGQAYSLVSDPHAGVMATVADGTGDVIIFRTTTTDQVTYPFMIRRGALGADVGVVRWQTDLPASVTGAYGTAGTFNHVVSDTAVVVFANSGVFFYDLSTGAVTTRVPVEMLQSSCPLDPAFAWTARILDPMGASGDMTNDFVSFSRPASREALVLGSFGPCLFMFNSRRELALYRIPFFTINAQAEAFSVYAPAGAAPAVAASTTGTVEKYILPMGFLTPSRVGAPMPSVDYRRPVPATRAWVANLQSTGHASMAGSIVASDTLFVSDTTALSAVDLRSGKLLWRYTEYLNTHELPIRVHRGHIFMVTLDPSPMMVVVGAFPLDLTTRTLRTLPLDRTFNGPLLAPSRLIGGRILVVQSGPRLLGVDVETLDLRWNVTGGPDRQSLVRPVPAPRDSPLFGAFVAAQYQAVSSPTTIRDGATGDIIGTVTATGFTLAALEATCTGHGPRQRCAVIFSDDPNDSVGGGDQSRVLVSVIPGSTAVPVKLPPIAGPGPTSPAVPPHFHYTAPAPRNQAPNPVPKAPSNPSVKFPPPVPQPNFVFESNGVVFSAGDQAVGVNTTTGALAWRAPPNETLAGYCPVTINMATGSRYFVTMYGCYAGGLLVIANAMDTGAQVFETVVTRQDVGTASQVQDYGATIGTTVCHAYSNNTDDAQGAMCYDVSSAVPEVFYHQCPASPLQDLRSNPARTAVIMTCSATYVAALEVGAKIGGVAWAVTAQQSAANGLPQIPRPSPFAPTTPGVLLLSTTAPRTFHLTAVDPDTGSEHRWALNIDTVIGAHESLAAATPLSVRYVALQSQSTEAIVDVFTRTVVLSKTYNANAVCCSDLECCGSVRMIDARTVVSACSQRGTVVSYDVATKATNWESPSAIPYHDSVELHLIATPGPVLGDARAIAVSNLDLIMFDADTGAVVWSEPGSAIFAAATSACLWTMEHCYAYAPALEVRTSRPVNRLFPLHRGVLVSDNENIYSLNVTAGPDGATPKERHVTPSSSPFTGGVLFGGTNNDRFFVAEVNGRWWVFDVYADTAAVFAFDYPLDNPTLSDPRTQSPMLNYAVGLPGEGRDSHSGGVLYIPGEFSGVLALIASSAAGKVTFAMKFWQSGQKIGAPLSIYRRSGQPAMPLADRTCGVLAPIGAGIVVLDCVRLSPWWSSPTPAAGSFMAPVASGDYVLYFTESRLVYASAITGRTVWRSTPLAFKDQPSLYVWNSTVFFSALIDPSGVAQAVFQIDLAYDRRMPADLGVLPVIVPGTSGAGFTGEQQFIFTQGIVVMPHLNGLTATSLSTGALLWTAPAIESVQTELYAVVGGTLLITASGPELHSVNLVTGAEAGLYNLRYRQTQLLVAIPGTSAVAVAVHPTAVQIIEVNAAPARPPAPRGPTLGLPPDTYPPATSTGTAAPTFAPGALVPSLGCVSRVVGAAEGFVSCVDNVAQAAYTTARWGTTGDVRFSNCGHTADALLLCGVTYLTRMGLECPTGADHIKALYASLNATHLFGVCPNVGSGTQCETQEASRTLCGVMDGNIAVAGVVTLHGNEHIAPGFSFPSAPAFAPAPTQPPASPAPPKPPRGAATTFAIRYGPGVSAPSATALGTAIRTYLLMPAVPVTVRILGIEGSVASGQWVFFNVTSANAEDVAEQFSLRTESDNAQGLGGVQFGLYFPGEAPPSAPPTPSSSKGIELAFVAAAAVGAAVLAAVVAAVVMFVVMRRSAQEPRVGNESLVGVMSHRELKSMQEGMLTDAPSPYEEA